MFSFLFGNPRQEWFRVSPDCFTETETVRLRSNGRYRYVIDSEKSLCDILKPYETQQNKQ